MWEQPGCISPENKQLYNFKQCALRLELTKCVLVSEGVTEAWHYLWAVNQLVSPGRTTPTSMTGTQECEGFPSLAVSSMFVVSKSPD